MLNPWQPLSSANTWLAPKTFKNGTYRRTDEGRGQLELR
jgi:hypothetical protein